MTDDDTHALVRRVSHVFLDALMATDPAQVDDTKNFDAIGIALESLGRLEVVKVVRPEGSLTWQTDITALCAGPLRLLHWMTLVLADTSGTDYAAVIANARQYLVDCEDDLAG